MNNNLSEKSIKQKVINFFKNPKEALSFILPIVFALIMICPVPYYVTIGGGVLSLDDKIKISGEKDKNGSLNSAYVMEIKSNVLFYLLSYVVPSYERSKVKDVILEEESIKDYAFRSRLDFTNSIDNATKVAFEKAGKEVKITKTHFYVSYVFKEAITDIKTGDEIIKIENSVISSYEELTNLITNYYYKDELKITVLRDKKEIICYAKPTIIEEAKKIGINIIEKYDLETNPKMTLNFTSSEQGPSGGLMLALNIYNKLVANDITKGKKIVGTGTIDFDGTVGAIGGVKYKVMGAAKAKADIFLVPIENYKEANDFKNEKGYKIKIIPISSFDEALIELSK